jgi:hypothetical protein
MRRFENVLNIQHYYFPGITDLLLKLLSDKLDKFI